MSDELRPCAHCGGDHVVEEWIRHDDCWRRWRVSCDTCGMSTDWHGTREAALATWNRRADDTPELLQDDDGEYDCRTCDAKRELQERVDSLTAERDLLDQAYTAVGEACTDAEMECECLQDKVDELTAKRDELQSIIDHMPKTEQECEACQEAHDRLMFNAKVDMDELRAECDRLREKMRWTDSMNNKLREKLDEKQHVCDVQRESFRKMEKLLADAKAADYVAMRDEAEMLSAENARLKAENRELHMKVHGAPF